MRAQNKEKGKDNMDLSLFGEHFIGSAFNVLQNPRCCLFDNRRFYFRCVKLNDKLHFSLTQIFADCTQIIADNSGGNLRKSALDLRESAFKNSIFYFTIIK